MTTISDLPASIVHLITRAARTRFIRGTNWYAQVCRSWRDAPESEDQEQLQLLLALEGLPADTLTSTSEWMDMHGACVTSLYITYDPATAPLFQQLPLSTAPLVGLVQLELDGPDSLVAIIPALPQLVSLTHLGASIEVVATGGNTQEWSQGVFSAKGVPLDAAPCLQQLCPGLKSLRLDICCDDPGPSICVEAPVVQLLPGGLQHLHLHNDSLWKAIGVLSSTLTPFTSLRTIHLEYMDVMDPDDLLLMPELQAVSVYAYYYWVNGAWVTVEQWLAGGLCTAQQHVTKLTGLRFVGCPDLSPVLTAVTSLRRLQLTVEEPDAGTQLQQLWGLTGLRQLDLHIYCTTEQATADAVMALTRMHNLTYLSFYSETTNPPPPTWAAVLPHLNQLRMLVVSNELLLEGGLAAELTRLVQLQSLYVDEWVDGECDAAAIRAKLETAPHLQLLSKCNRLLTVWYSAWYGDADGDVEEQKSALHVCEIVHEAQPAVCCWHKWQRLDVGRMLQPRACPHLPGSGVWELQQQV
jgi:hypothetical protein